MARELKMHTLSHVLDAKGYFDSNPANINSRGEDGESLYAGPVEFPKMLYHPTGEKRTVEPARIEPTSIGPVAIPAKFELIHQIVNGPEEEEKLLAAGWHLTPAEAMGLPVPVSPVKRAASLEAENAELRAQLAAAKRAKVGPISAGGGHAS